ncbi:hypothetical protein DI392_11275 [Vibrio albus]|uniref:Flavinylation-associated cytochrome domain-containing protein n=1 Tax=Vibrio albus TaxID=2200953 RepID=A0A2U3B9S9_9VIBR|nr:hypothetical protein DI392_11275 [Vibrio albus]
MKLKYIYQVAQDSVMVILFGALMGFHLWQESTHEWLGLAFLLIVFKHLVLNNHWFQRLWLGDYDLFRALKLAINIVLAGLLITAIVSGVVLSQHIFADFFFHNASDMVRKTHMTSVHWLQIIMAVHLGMHWKMLARFFSQLWHISENSRIAKFGSFLSLMLSVYGVSIFIQRDMSAYLLLQVDYAFFDFEQSVAGFYFDYIAVTILFAYTTRFFLWLFLFRNEQPVKE